MRNFDYRIKCVSCLMRLCLGVALCVVVSCQQAPPSPPVISAAELAHAQAIDPLRLTALADETYDIQSGLLSLKASGGWRQRGYFSAQESDLLEGLLQRLHRSHQQLVEMMDRHQRVDAQPASQKVSQKAHQQLLEQARFVVGAFDADRIAISKLNQRYPRSDVPRRTYDRLADLTKPWPSRTMAQWGREVQDEWQDSSYGVQAEVITQAGRFKNPAAHLVHFSEAQKKRVESLLQPGDILLTYTAGYASTVFIPGSFKHAMVYVGSVEQRQEMGLIRNTETSQGDSENHLKTRHTSEGRKANVIEAVLAGVKFSNLAQVMDTRINRLAVLRPQLTEEERSRYLVKVFSYLGQEYDFRFDFNDSSRQVCTEIVYRSLNGLNEIDFQLALHTGHLTLSSDDILRYGLEKRPEAFEFILYVEEAKLRPGHPARLRSGELGERRLKQVIGM